MNNAYICSQDGLYEIELKKWYWSLVPNIIKDAIEAALQYVVDLLINSPIFEIDCLDGKKEKLFIYCFSIFFLTNFYSYIGSCPPEDLDYYRLMHYGEGLCRLGTRLVTSLMDTQADVKRDCNPAYGFTFAGSEAWRSGLSSHSWRQIYAFRGREKDARKPKKKGKKKQKNMNDCFSNFSLHTFFFCIGCTYLVSGKMSHCLDDGTSCAKHQYSPAQPDHLIGNDYTRTVSYTINTSFFT